MSGRRGGRDVAAHIRWPSHNGRCVHASPACKNNCVDGRTADGLPDRAGLVFAMHYLYPLACVHTGPLDKRISPVASLPDLPYNSKVLFLPGKLRVEAGNLSVSTKVSKLIGRLIFPLQFVRNGGLNLSLYLTQL